MKSSHCTVATDVLSDTVKKGICSVIPRSRPVDSSRPQAELVQWAGRVSVLTLGARGEGCHWGLALENAK